MDRVTTFSGTGLPLDRADVDTDQIIPAKYLKRIERTGYGPFAFEAWAKDPDFVTNQPQYEGASVLLAGPNFGCGSSREHAVWAIQGMGVQGGESRPASPTSSATTRPRWACSRSSCRSTT